MPTIPKQESQNVEFKESWNDGFRNAGLADPVIEEDEGGIRITLFRPAWVARELGAALVAKKMVGPESGPESKTDTIVMRCLSVLADEALGKTALAHAIGQRAVSGRL